MGKIENAFRELSRTEKVKFISANIDLATSESVSNYVRDYLFDVLKDIGDDDYIEMYLKGKGYSVKKEQ